MPLQSNAGGGKKLKVCSKIFLPGESHGQRSLQTTVHGVARVGHDLAIKKREKNSFIFGLKYCSSRLDEGDMDGTSGVVFT